jgi:hypothetical protein
MDLKRIFSGRVVGLIVFILAVLLLGAMFNVKLEGMEEGAGPVAPVSVGPAEKEKEMMTDPKRDGMESMMNTFFGGNSKTESSTVQPAK